MLFWILVGLGVILAFAVIVATTTVTDRDMDGY